MEQLQQAGASPTDKSPQFFFPKLASPCQHLPLISSSPALSALCEVFSDRAVVTWTLSPFSFFFFGYFPSFGSSTAAARKNCTWRDSLFESATSARQVDCWLLSSSSSSSSWLFSFGIIPNSLVPFSELWFLILGSSWVALHNQLSKTTLL